MCVFTARITERQGEYVIEVPEREVSLGDIDNGGRYRVAVLPTAMRADAAHDTPGQPDTTGDHHVPPPPVDEGDTREIQIEEIGEQGDGIARVERGYVLFVPETELGDRVTIEVTRVRENFAFGTVIDGPTSRYHPYR